MFSFYLDLDEVGTIAKQIPLIGINQHHFYALYDDDHFESSKIPLKEKVIDFVHQQNAVLDVEKVYALTNLRFLGYVFNPITVFFCYGKAGELQCAVAEVGNTFGEKKPYFIAADCNDSGVLQNRQPKQFYVSPFINLDTDVRFSLRAPNEKLNLRIETLENDQVVLAATMNGDKHEFNTKTLVMLTLKYPFVTFGVIAAIHFHALILWLKKIPFIRKEDNPQLQIGVIRPVKHSVVGEQL